jgi:hypothetical protein
MHKQKVVESTFARDGVALPHEPVHCKTTKAVALCFLECQCGYKGIAHVVDGNPVCPAHLARVEQFNRETHQSIEAMPVDTQSAAIKQLIAEAVAEALAQAKGGN